MLKSRVDPLSWLIYIDGDAPSTKAYWWKDLNEDETVKRQLFHETIHFWHSISTTQGLELAFDSLKSMNALRFAARQGEDLSQFRKDFTFDGYPLFRVLRNWQIPGATGIFNINNEPERVKPFISITHLFEGLARFWETAVFETNDPKALCEILLTENDTYGKAFKYLHDKTGEQAAVLFPIFAYTALNTEYEEVIRGFDWLATNYARNGFEIDLSQDLEHAWLKAWEDTQQWNGVVIKPYGPMSSYRVEHRRFVKWKLQYAGLIPEDFSLNGHPILEGYIHRMMRLAGYYCKNESTKQRETFMVPDFVLPGISDHLPNLATLFMPPMVSFHNEAQWVHLSEWYEKGDAEFAKSMETFSGLMGAAISLVHYDRDHRPVPTCGVKSCPLFNERVCAQVIQKPKSEFDCLSLHDISKEYGLLTEEVEKIPKPPAPIRNLKSFADQNSLLMLLQKINRIEKESQVEIFGLLKFAMTELPAMSGGFWLFIEDHLNNATVSQKEFETGLDMVAAAMKGIAGHYDARTGIEFRFTGHPMVCALMASVCFQIARKLGGVLNIEIAAALFMEALKPLVPLTEQLWKLGIDIGYVAEKLEPILKESDAPSKVKELMKKWELSP